MPGIRSLVALSFMAAVGAMLVILGCVLYNNQFWPLMVLTTYILSPLPNYIAKRCTRDSFSYTASSPCIDLGRFMTAALTVSGFGIPLVMAHAGAIEVGAMLLTVFGNVLIFATIGLYNIMFQAEDSW